MTGTLGIIQARLGSQRLPQKMLKELHGYTLMSWVWQRASAAKGLDDVMVAIPDLAMDDPLAAHLQEMGAKVFRGSGDDVLGRFYACASIERPSHIVRICADNPFLCPQSVDDLIQYYSRQEHCDYAYNHIPRDNLYPDGLGAEMISMDLLTKMNEKASSEEQREHMMNYIWEHPGQYSIHTFDPPNPELRYPDIKLDIDTPDDFQRLSRLKNIGPSTSSAQIIREYRSQVLD